VTRGGLRRAEQGGGHARSFTLYGLRRRFWLLGGGIECGAPEGNDTPLVGKGHMDEIRFLVIHEKQRCRQGFSSLKLSTRRTPSFLGGFPKCGGQAGVARKKEFRGGHSLQPEGVKESRKRRSKGSLIGREGFC